jgi:tRNA dimethylallyltransferase
MPARVPGPAEREAAVRPKPAAAAPLLVVILGPTASGKSALALALAETFHGEIVSCDSVAVYRYFEIGTAKPGRQERARIPHSLLDIAEPGEAFTAGEYARQARAAIADIVARGKLPVVVGGTGLYLRALLEGLFPGPRRSEELRTRLRGQAGEHGSQHLHRVLQRLDATAAAQIHPNDTPKLIRAIEVCLAARAPMSDLWRQRGRDPLLGYRILRIGLNPEREKLYARVNRRAAEMFERGLAEETRELLQRFPDLGDATPFTSLGYKQAVQHLHGEFTRAQAVAQTQQGHRNFAKRQMTWFRREPDVLWLEGFGDDRETQVRAENTVRQALAAEEQIGDERRTER